MTEPEIIAALSELNIFALTLWGEVRNEPIEGIVGVACVVRNRVRTQYRGTTYREVCLAPWQFSCWKVEGGKANHEALMALARALVSGQEPKDHAFLECAYVADGIISDTLRDRVGKARHYHTATMKPWPEWAIDKTPAFQVASHLFYEGIS